MKKPTIYATGNENVKGDYNVSYYIVEKDDSFLDWLERLLIEVLGINPADVNVKFIFKEINGEDGFPIGQEVYAKEIKKMVDVHEKYGDKEDRVDLFYGKDRVYVTFRKSRETREKFGKFVRKTKDWVNIEKKELPFYAGRRVKKEVFDR